jgi:very-short-patch-repair endonuclease
MRRRQGAQPGHTVRPETRAKIGRANSDALRRRWQDPAYREMMRASHRRVWRDPQYRMRMVVAHTGKPGPWRGKRRPEIVALWAEKHDEWASALAAGRTVRPTLPERRFLRISQAHSLGFRYVGDGQIRIGGLNPDFMNETRREVVEVLGRYWHQPGDLRRTTRPSVRYAIFKRQGWRAFFLWEDELADIDAVLDRVRGMTKCAWD